MSDENYNPKVYPAVSEDGAQDGVCLFDEIAIRAMQAMLTNPSFNNLNKTMITKAAYDMAESMLAERYKRPHSHPIV